MQNKTTPRPPVAAGIGRGNPVNVNVALLLDVMEILLPGIESRLPSKRSGYSYGVFVLFQACVQLLGTSAKVTGEIINEMCKIKGKSFHSFETTCFSNKKHRRFFPDQPSLSRCLKNLSKLGLTEIFWNEVNFSHLLLLKDLGIAGPDINLIADYKEASCPKDKDDPYCFGTKEGKTVHKTLAFSVLSGGLHQVIFAFKIAKRQNKLPLFAHVIRRLQANGFRIKHALLDRGFYRKRLLVQFKRWRITVIMPGRDCTGTRKLTRDFLNGKGTRIGKGQMRLKYVRGFGYPYLEFDLVLQAKRSYRLDAIKRDYNKGKLSLDDASKRIFPLLVLLASKRGIKKIKGNENYIRTLYRARWNIEIAFREMNKLGITTHYRHRDGRLAAMGARILVYNMWQVQRHILKKAKGESKPLELAEFLGRSWFQRHVVYAVNVGKNRSLGPC
ncbi:MAG: transposase [Candidatus Hodarchaeota archaeon]